MANERSSSTFYQSSAHAAPDGNGRRSRVHPQDGYSKYGSTFASSHENDAEASSFYGESPPGGYEASSHRESASVTNGGRVSSNSSGPRSTLSSIVYATDAQGLYRDPNPQLIRRAAAGGVQTYTQRVTVRFLQPPAVPPPGPLIIKEVRPPQPPAPPPLYIRQRPPPPPTLAPIVIREAPPKLPPAVGTQVITRMLPPLPVPPRSVIIERLPPLPPRPRDVIVERWLPYRNQQKRRIIVQRAPPAPVQKPRNIIIYYEAPKAQVVRRFQNLGVQHANPTDYIARYGTQLEDAQSLVTHARQAGVIEDISPPVGGESRFQSTTAGYDASSGYSSAQGFEYDSINDHGLAGGSSLEPSFGNGRSTGRPTGLVGNPRNYESSFSRQAYI